MKKAADKISRRAHKILPIYVGLHLVGWYFCIRRERKPDLRFVEDLRQGTFKRIAVK